MSAVPDDLPGIVLKLLLGSLTWKGTSRNRDGASPVACMLLSFLLGVLRVGESDGSINPMQAFIKTPTL